jgi:predicted AlkP superfamily pyrophosphatase or phosphodiesterase
MRPHWQSLVLAVALATVVIPSPAWAGGDDRDDPGRGRHPRPSQVVVISLDGAQPDLVEQYLHTGVLDRGTGLGRLRRHGVVARRNVTATPSVTAVAHIAIATGSTAPHNDISANTFHPVAAPIATSISGFAAPIGGYTTSPLGPSPEPTAEPLWVRLRAAGKTVVTATWPGSDGADIRISGALVQAAAPTRTVDYTVPFGAFGGLGAQGFTLTAASFTAAGPALVGQLAAAGRVSYSPVQVTTNPLETVFCAPATTATCGTTSASGRTLRYDIHAAALDTTDDGAVNYDTLVVFDGTVGVPAGPFSTPSTGPAYVRAGGPSGPFFFEGSGNEVGTAFFVSHLAPDLAAVRGARYAANFIPRNAPVIAVVDDVNDHVGFWRPQPDFRIPERLSPGFTAFPDLELEAMYLDQVATFTRYQTQVALRAIAQNPDADLVMIYLEQPDGSGHQFTLTDKRQPTNPLDNRTIGRPGHPSGAAGQDPGKVARYARYLEFAYQQANAAVEAIVDVIGSRRHGEPLRDVFVVSDHGMAPFHTAVNVRNLLVAAGINPDLIGIRTTGPATNIYVNLQGREPGGTVAPADYAALVADIAAALRGAADPNDFYNPRGRRLFSHVWTRPTVCGQPGFCTDRHIGQDTGDVLALMVEGYNFDGAQTPLVARLGDTSAAVTSIYSVPNFYGAHGHDSALPSMSAILYAAGPSLKKGKTVDVVRNIDVAPTVLEILGVAPAPTVDGEVIVEILEYMGGSGRPPSPPIAR